MWKVKLLRFKGKVVLITGAGSGIGRATARLFAQEGAKVVVADVDPEGGKETVNIIEKEGGEAAFVGVDVTKLADVKRMVEFILDKYGRINVLFNNVGIELYGKYRLEDTSEEDWDKLLGVNLKGVFLCSKYVIPEMIKQGGGVIINNASIDGLHAFPSPNTSYCASKGGLVLLSKAMAKIYAPHNIRVNCICPGPVATGMTKPTDKMLNQIPIHRIGKPEEIANVVLFLASNESSFMVGSTVVVDGGQTA